MLGQLMASVALFAVFSTSTNGFSTEDLTPVTTQSSPQSTKKQHTVDPLKQFDDDFDDGIFDDDDQGNAGSSDDDDFDDGIFDDDDSDTDDQPSSGHGAGDDNAADDDNAAKPKRDFTPIQGLSSGIYLTKDGFFDRLTIERWGDEYIVKGSARYGNTLQPFEMTLRHMIKNDFIGKGSIKMTFGRKTCTYDIKVRVDAFEEGLYIRSIQPSQLPGAAPVNGCYLAGKPMSMRHNRPYQLHQP